MTCCALPFALERKVTNLSLRRQGLDLVVVPRGTSIKDALMLMNLNGLLEIRSFGYRLEPRYIFRAGRLDQ